MEHEGDGDTTSNLRNWNGPQMIGKRTGTVRNPRKNRNYPDNSIVEIAQNTEKSPGDPKRFAITQTPVKAHQLTRKD